MKTVRIICRIITGMVFIFSGFVKGIDPLGSTYKFNDYFLAFGIDFLDPIALPLAIVLSAAEFIIGISLLFGFRIQFGSWGVLLFMSLFTPLTFFIAIFNPVSDCGCFGDAIVLTNWETFFKNIIIMALVIIIFLSRRKFTPVYSGFTEWSLMGVILFCFFILSIHNYRHLPMMDFRPYHIGAYIPEKIKIPDGAPMDEYETVLIYEKDGIQQEFTMDDYPWQDSSWNFVDQKSFLIKKGYTPPIHDFDIISTEGNNITDLVLADDRYSFLLVFSDLARTNMSGLEKVNELAFYCSLNDYPFYGITASTASEIFKLQERISLNFEIYNTDETTLKTIIRSNPGLMLLKKGIIIGKWHYNDFPEVNELSDHYLATLLEKYSVKQNNSLSLNLILLLFLGLSLFEIIGKKIYLLKRK